MKIIPEHFNELKDKLEIYMVNRSYNHLLEHYKKEKMGKNPERLLCFNIFYQLDINWRNEFITKIYGYADDDHLFTALKKALKV